MSADDLAPILLIAGNGGQIGFRQGTVVDWNSSTGENTINVGGTELTNLPVLAASAITLAPGDVVGILTTRTSWMILGAITRNSLRIQAEQSDGTTHSVTPDGVFHDVAGDPGPSVDVMIGNSRQALVLMAMSINAVDCQVGCGVAVSGASSIPALNTAAAGFAIFGSSGDIAGGSVNSFQIITGDDGLNPGLNTFSLRYAAGNGTSGSSSHSFWNRRIAVIPF